MGFGDGLLEAGGETDVALEVLALLGDALLDVFGLDGLLDVFGLDG